MNRIANIIRSLCLSLLIVATTGCLREGNHETTPADTDSKLVRMHIRIPGNPSVGTRAFTDTYIETIDVLSFREDDGTFQYRATAHVIDTANEWFDIVLNKSHDEQQVLVILANLKDELDGTTLTPGTTTRDQLYNTLTIRFVHQTVYDPTHNPSNQVSGQYGEDRALPMWGEYGPIAIVDDITNLGTIYMLRSLAAVTVLINLDTTDPDQKHFELVDVAIYNTADKGFAIPDPDHIEIPSSGNIKATDPTIPSGTLYNNAYYASTDGVTITDGIYIGERSNTATGIAEDDRTWLLIGGIYDHSGEVTWYRVPFIDRDGKQWDILRNHNYIFNIYKVTGPGHGEEEAKDADIYADVIPWNEGADERFDIEGQYWIWIDPSSASYDIEGGSGVITVDTNYPGGCTATVSASETDLHDPCPWLTVDSTPTGTQLNYSVAATDEWAHRRGYIHIRAGSFAVTVRIDQAYLYIDGISVTPTGDISGDGENRVIRATGKFDDVPVHVWDITNNSEIVQSAANSFIPGNLATGNPSSVTVTIPQWTQDNPRTVEFRYFDKSVNDWVSILQATQEGFNFQVASTLTNGSTIAAQNQSYNINVSGTSWPAIYVRGVIRGTQTVVAGPITIPAGSGSGTTQSITIGTYQQWKDQTTRQVELQWSRNNSEWTSPTVLNYGNQTGNYEVSGSSVADPAIENGENLTIRALLPSGGQLTVKVSGSYASGWVQVRSVTADGATVVSTSTPTITDVSSQTVGLPIGTNYNYTGTATNAGHRNIKCQYRRWVTDAYGNNGAWEATWSPINATDIQQLGYVTLTSGRVVAIEDAKSTHHEKADHFLWTEAMGISSIYKTQSYPQAALSPNNNGASVNSREAVMYYTTTYAKGNGGCADYTEEGTSNNFYIPTREEILEMGQRFKELGKIAYAEEWEYWCNREYLGSDGWHSFAHDIEYKGWQDVRRDTYTKRVRCVRAK